KNESLRVVGIIPTTLRVERNAVIELRSMDEIHRYVLARLEGPYFGLCVIAPQWHVDSVIEPLNVRKPLTDAAIQRRDDADLVPCPAQCLGKGGHHVGQASALGIRMELAGGQQQ